MADVPSGNASDLAYRPLSQKKMRMLISRLRHKHNQAYMDRKQAGVSKRRETPPKISSTRLKVKSRCTYLRKVAYYVLEC